MLLFFFFFSIYAHLKKGKIPQQTENKVLVQHFWLFSRPTNGF